MSKPKATQPAELDTSHMHATSSHTATRFACWLQAHPTYGVRMTHVRLTKGLGMVVNRKKVHLIMRLHRWTCRHRRIGVSPRVEHRKSNAPAPNQHWAADIASVDCGQDGWCASVPVIDCCSR